MEMQNKAAAAKAAALFCNICLAHKSYWLKKEM